MLLYGIGRLFATLNIVAVMRNCVLDWGLGEKRGTGQTVGWIAARGWKPTAKVVVVGGNHLHHRKQFVSNQPRTHVDADALVNSMCTQCAAGGKPKLDLIRSHSKLSLVSSCKKFIYFYYMYNFMRIYNITNYRRDALTCTRSSWQHLDHKHELF